MAKILVVDDEAAVRQLVRIVLEGEGHSVMEAANGTLGLQEVEAFKPELLVLDVMMPGMDGYDVLRELRRRGLKKGMRVLLLTAKSAESDFIAGWKLGVDEYMTKPFDPELLARTARMTLQMSDGEVIEKRRHELEKANLFSRIESAFGEGTFD
ncbi:MAG TPA: response regulator [Actinomycetota bacterium]|nr:response regulator [Actinomycetota bacterium]